MRMVRGYQGAAESFYGHLDWQHFTAEVAPHVSSWQNLQMRAHDSEDTLEYGFAGSVHNTNSVVLPIDLNTQDLDQLRAQIRGRFSRSVLSDGALNGIINLRRGGKPIYDISELLVVRGVSAAVVRELAKHCRAALMPLEIPVRVVLWDHPDIDDVNATCEENVRLVNQMRIDLDRIEIARPIIIGFEQGLDFIPEEISTFKLGAALGCLGPDIGFESAVSEYFSGKRRAPNLDRLFRREYDLVVRQIRAVFSEGRLAPLRYMSCGVELLNLMAPVLEGRKVQVVWEDPSFESWKSSVGYKVLLGFVHALLANGQIDQALPHFHQALEIWHRGVGIGRDETLSKELSKYLDINPNAYIWLSRGAGHVFSLMPELERSGIKFDVSNLANPNRNDFLSHWIRQGCLTPKSEQGRRILLQSLIADCEGYAGNQNSVGLEGSLAFHLNDEELHHWSKKIVGNGPNSFEKLADMTASWLLALGQSKGRAGNYFSE